MIYENMNYPHEIICALAEITNILDIYCTNIILYGSTATNDLVYEIKDGVVYLYSDIEFIVIPKSESDAYNKQFQLMLYNSIQSYLEGAKNIVIPHVDVNPVSYDFFVEAQRRICIFELKHNGKVIKGENCLDILPLITIQNYDPTIQNIEIVKGLKILLIEAYRYFLCNDTTSEKRNCHFMYFLSSSFLNTLRTLLPLFGKFCLTATSRVDAIGDLRNDTRILQYYSEEILDLYKKILLEKSTCEYTISAEDLFYTVIIGYRSLLCLILEVDDDLLLSAIEQRGHNIFDGSLCKKKQLALLTCFFISSLDGFKQLLQNGWLPDSSLDTIKHYFDQMIHGRNSYDFFNIVSRYSELEKSRWRIIGSKD